MEFMGSATPLSHEGTETALSFLNIDAASLWALIDVETAGCGYLPDKRIVILFERHVFSRLTGGIYDQRHPEISGAMGGYGITGPHQHERLELAMLIDKDSALKSASWGLGQIMGGNYSLAGYDSVAKMVGSFAETEDAQLLAVAWFIKTQKLDAMLRAKDWNGFARIYNGPMQRHYGDRLAEAYNKFSARLPDLDVRKTQMELMFMGLGPITIDGILGPETSACMAKVAT